MLREVGGETDHGVSEGWKFGEKISPFNITSKLPMCYNRTYNLLHGALVNVIR